jgi:hypothetical protein
MRVVSLSLAIVTAAVVLATAVHGQSTPPAPGVLRGHWSDLLKGGCNLEKSGVATPIDARVLRNTPFAMKGYAFKSADLTALFGSDGGWYIADPKSAPTFAGAEQACIDKLKKHEDALRKKVALDATFEARFTATLDAVKALREMSQGFGASTLQMTSQKTGTGLQYVFTEQGCKKDCTAIFLICEADQPCVALGAG